MKTRIYIESDILHKHEYDSAKNTVELILEEMGEPFIPDIFDKALDFAWRDLEKTWTAVKEADEIYASTSLLPLAGGYVGAPMIFDGMCERAVREKVIGKSVYVLRRFDDICWERIDIVLMKKAFKKNELYVFDDNRDLVKVDMKRF